MKTMPFVHEENLLTKIKNNHNNIGSKIKKFYENIYKPMSDNLLNLDFNCKNNNRVLKTATKIITDYYNTLTNFEKNNEIKGQSKFSSSFLEELNIYLFKDLDNIKNGNYKFYNKGIFKGLFYDDNDEINILKKDVDFAIAKEMDISFNGKNQSILIPLVAIEVKTYLDATMLNEAKSASRDLKSGTPNCKCFILMGYSDVKELNYSIIRADNSINEIFKLRNDETDSIHFEFLLDYWFEIKNIVDKLKKHTISNKSSRMLNYLE